MAVIYGIVPSRVLASLLAMGAPGHKYGTGIDKRSLHDAFHDGFVPPHLLLVLLARLLELIFIVGLLELHFHLIDNFLHQLDFLINPHLLITNLLHHG